MPVKKNKKAVSETVPLMETVHRERRELHDYRDTWRIFRVMAELVEGYNFLMKLKREVTVLGSARFAPDHELYKLAQQVGGILAKLGFTTITGGGPGIMQATNQGAFEAGGASVGLNIQLPFEQRINPYVKQSIAFYYFFTRKVMLTSPADAFILFPGGYGTLDEFFEVVDLMELGMLSPAPVILMNSEFWTPLLTFLREKGEATGSLQENQIVSWQIVDKAEDIEPLLANTRDNREVSCDLSPNNFYCDGNIDWKIFRVMAELVEGFEFVSGLSRAVTILGTKSIMLENPYYEAAYSLGGLLAKDGYSVVTGGKFGVAEAANKGAFEAGGVSIGIGMRFGVENQLNAYLSRSILFSFPFTRKLIITAPTQAFVFFPGGLGTMHQLFEILTLIQTKKMDPVPVILYDSAFWEPLDTFIRKTLIEKVATIAPGDERLYVIVDTEEEIMRSIHAAEDMQATKSL